MLYDNETWQGLIMRCLQVILGVTMWDEKRNTDLRDMAGSGRVEVMLMRRKLWWLGHVVRMEETHISGACLCASQI